MKSLYLLGLLAGATSLSGQYIVPLADAGTEGNSSVSVALNPGTGVSVRYQQVYHASEFFYLTNSGGGWIYTLGFRTDTGLGIDFVSTLPSVQINFSTTPNAPDSLSPVFADNVGSDDAMVFGPRSLTLSGSYSPFVSPQSFSLGIRLERPFFYNPAAGNLLLDVRNFGGGLTSPVDGVETSGDSVSRVWAIGVGALSGTPDTRGMVTRFEIAPIPEPTAGRVFPFGVGCWLCFRCYRACSAHPGHSRPQSTS